MIVKEWGFVALESGLIQVGVLTEYKLGNETVLRVELPRPNGLPSFFEYHKMKDIKGIRVSSQTECEQYYPKILEMNTGLKKAMAA